MHRRRRTQCVILLLAICAATTGCTTINGLPAGNESATAFAGDFVRQLVAAWVL